MDNLWWSQISKASSFLNSVVNTALEGKSLVLFLPEYVPWYNTLVELIENKLNQENPNNSLDKIECPKGEVGEFLLDKYCKKEKRATYRYGMTYASFLAKSDDIVLNNRYVWVKDIPSSKMEEWMEFIVEYNKELLFSKTPAIFILEARNSSMTLKPKKGIRTLVFEKNIDAYDKFAFCTLAATQTKCKNHMRPYLAELVSSVCKEDIELCAECVEEGDNFLKSPMDVIQKIISSTYRSDGMDFQFQHTQDELKHIIWESQLKLVFPIIEKYRNYFVKKYSSIIQSALPMKNSFGEVVDNPLDVEIGALSYLVGNKTISLNSQEYEELEMFRIARNKLAHLNVLELDVVDKILKYKV